MVAGREPGDLNLGTLANQVLGEVIEVGIPFRLRQCSTIMAILFVSLFPLGHQHSRALEAATPEIGQRFVRARQRIDGGCRFDAGLGRDGEKLGGVAARQIRDGYNVTLLPQERVGELWNVAHVNAAANDAAALANGGKRVRNERSDWREDDGGIQRFRGSFVRTASPARAERQGQALAGASPERVKA